MRFASRGSEVRASENSKTFEKEITSIRSSQRTGENFNVTLMPKQEIIQKENEQEEYQEFQVGRKEESSLVKENYDSSKNQEVVEEQIEEDIVQSHRQEEKEKWEHESGTDITSWQKQSTEVTLTDEMAENSNGENKERKSNKFNKDKRNESLLTNTSTNSAGPENESINNKITNVSFI